MPVNEYFIDFRFHFAAYSKEQATIFATKIQEIVSNANMLSMRVGPLTEVFTDVDRLQPTKYDLSEDTGEPQYSVISLFGKGYPVGIHSICLAGIQRPKGVSYADIVRRLQGDGYDIELLPLSLGNPDGNKAKLVVYNVNGMASKRPE